MKPSRIASAIAAALLLQLPVRLPAAPPDQDETVELSPFILREDQDTGYAPNETLSGTRLRSQAKDVAAAMTIVTPDLMKDLGALNYNDVLNFMPSTSVYTSTPDDANSNGPRTGTPMTVRGYRSDSISTNFFTSFTKPDLYNTSRLTFTRGPNSILFSIGNPGGAIDVTTNKADLKRSLASIDLRADSIGGRRASLDANVPLPASHAGLRLDLLHDDRGNVSAPAKDRRDSIFLTTTYQPLPQTTIYANLESTHLRQQIPRPYETFDWTSTWLGAGKPVIATAQKNSAVNGVEFLASNGYPDYIPGIGAMDWSKMGHGARPLVRGARVSAFSYGVGTPNRPVALTDYVAGDSDRVDFDDENYAVIVQHRLADGLYLELGASHDHNYRENLDGDGNGFAVEVDTNAQLPNGAPNPNVGRFYTDQNPKWERGRNDDNQLRATLSYEKDLRQVKIFQRGLGRFTLAALYNNEAKHGYGEVLKEVNETPLPISTPDLSDNRNSIHRRTYFGAGNPDYFVSNYAPINENGIKSGWESVRAPGPHNDFTRTQSYSLAGQANLLDDFVALTAGLRRDESLITQTQYVKDSRGVYPGPQGGSPLPDVTGVGRPYLYGVVVNALPNLSGFFNRAINYQPISQGVRTFANEILPPVRGRGLDTGVKFDLWHERVSGSFGYFVTEQVNIKDTAVTRGSKATWINQIWDAIDPSQRVDTSAADVKAQKTHGIEFQLVANPTRNLRLMANVSRNLSTLEDQGDFTFRYLAQQYPVWLAQANRAVVSSDGKTVGDLVTRIQQEASDDQWIIGIEQVRYFRWQANVVGRYQFAADSPGKGFAVGSAFRWRDAPVIGFARSGTVLDPTRPFHGSVSTNLDAFVEYSRAVAAFGRKLRWTSQVRVQNVLDDRTLQPWIADDDGTGHATVEERLRPNERQFVASTSLAF